MLKTSFRLRRKISSLPDSPYFFNNSQKFLNELSHLFPHFYIQANLSMRSPVLIGHLFLVLS